MRLTFLCVFLCLLCDEVAADSEQQFADIGDLPLESGGVLQDARIGYRTAGALKADKSNVIVFTTWFTGTSGQMIQYGLVGPGMMADTERFHVNTV